MSQAATRLLLSLTALTALSGCGTFDAVRRAAEGPQLSPAAQPATYAAAQPEALPMPPAEPEVYAPNSLWRVGARSFFNDQRAARVGDILTVKIAIDDSAAVSNSTARSRKGSSDLGLQNFLGFESKLKNLLPNAVDNASLVNAAGDTSSAGAGTVNRAEKIELTVAAVVTQIMPNHNFVIAGRQEVRINGEVRDLTVAGVIRPEDIGADNTIRHTQIAEARISYGGRGTISTVQRPGWGQRVVDAVSPW